MSLRASAYNPNTTFNTDSSRTHDSQTLLSKNNNNNNETQQMDKTYASITPHRLRSQLLIHNLKTSGILPHNHADASSCRPPQLKHSARGLEAIGFDENASMYSCFRGEGERRVWKDEKGEEKKGVTGGKGRKFLKKLVGKGEGEGKGEKL